MMSDNVSFTVSMDGELYKDLKDYATCQKRTISDVVEATVKEWFRLDLEHFGALENDPDNEEW